MKAFTSPDEREQTVIVGAGALLLAAEAGGHLHLRMSHDERIEAINGALKFAETFVSCVEAHLAAKAAKP